MLRVKATFKSNSSHSKKLWNIHTYIEASKVFFNDHLDQKFLRIFCRFAVDTGSSGNI